MMGFALVWAIGLDRWGVPVDTHSTLAPFGGEAVCGPAMLLVSSFCQMQVIMSADIFSLLRILSSLCACALLSVMPLVPLKFMLHCTLDLVCLRSPSLANITDMPSGFLRGLNFKDLC